MLIVTGVLGTAPKGLERDLEELEIGKRIEAIQTTALLRYARIRRRVLEEKACSHSDSSERPSADAGVK